MSHPYAPSATPHLNVDHKQIRDWWENILLTWVDECVYAAIPVLGIEIPNLMGA